MEHTNRFDPQSKKWPGYVELYDPIPLVKVAVFEDVIRNIDRTKFSEANIQSTILPVIIPCVAEWHLDNFPENVTVETFPGTPRAASSILISKLVSEITKIYRGDEETDPNA